MERRERTEEKVQELFHTPAAGDEGTDPEFMQILQNYIFGDVCYTGSLDNRMRELVTITVLAAVQALPQLKAHLGACLHVGCTPVELREAVYQCAPFLGFPRTLNAIAVLNEVLTERRITLPLPRQGTLTSEQERYEKGSALQPPACGDALRERCARLPGGFAQAVPRFLTELSGDFATRSGLDGRTAHRRPPGCSGRGGGTAERPCARRPGAGQHPGGAGVRAGSRQRLHGFAPPVQRAGRGR